MPYKGVYVGRDSVNIFGRIKGFMPQSLDIRTLLIDKYVESNIYRLIENNGDLYAIYGSTIYKVDKETLTLTRITDLQIAGIRRVYYVYGNYLYVIAIPRDFYVYRIDMRNWRVDRAYLIHNGDIIRNYAYEICVWDKYIVLYDYDTARSPLIKNMDTGVETFVNLPRYGSKFGTMKFGNGYFFYCEFTYDYYNRIGTHYIVKYNPFLNRTEHLETLSYVDRTGETYNYGGLEWIIDLDNRVDMSGFIGYIYDKVIFILRSGFILRRDSRYRRIPSMDESILIYDPITMKKLSGFAISIDVDYAGQYYDGMLSNNKQYGWFEIVDLRGATYFLAYDGSRDLFIATERLAPWISGVWVYTFSIASSVYLDDDHIYVHREAVSPFKYYIFKYYLSNAYKSPVIKVS